MEGFKKMLDESEYYIGQITAEDGEADEPGMYVKTKTGARECDAIGIEEAAGTALLQCFNWRTYSREEFRSAVEEGNGDVDAACAGVDFDAPICVLETVIPVDQVVEMSVNTEGVFE